MSTAVPPATSRVGNNGAKGKGGENKLRTATTRSSIPDMGPGAARGAVSEMLQENLRRAGTGRRTLRAIRRRFR